MAQKNRKSLWERCFDFIFGYDLFISYSRIDWDEKYAVELARQLGQPPFEFVCFIDAKGFETGLSWKLQGRRALLKSSKIVLLLTPGVLLSPGVREELEYNKSLANDRKPIVIVSIQNAWEQVAQHQEFTQLLVESEGIAEDSLRIEDDACDKPSPEVLERIRGDFTLRTEKAKRTYALSIVAATLFVLMVAIAVFAGIAREQRNEATRQKEQAERSQSLVLTGISDAERARDEPNTSRFLALKALPERTADPERPLVNEAMNALVLADRTFVQPELVLYAPLEGAGDGGMDRVNFSAGDELIITHSWYGQTRIWDATTGALRAELGKRYGQHPQATLSPIEPLLALTSYDENQRGLDIWNLRKGTIQYSLQTDHSVRKMSFGRSHALVTAEKDGTVRIWSMASGLETARLAKPLVDNLDLRFSSAQSLVTFSKGGLIQTWDTNSGSELSSFDTGLGFIDRVDLSENGQLAVLFRAKSPSSYQITKSRRNDDEPWQEEKTCKPCLSEVWDLREHRKLGTLGEHEDPHSPLIQISPDLNTVGIANPRSREVTLWDVKTQQTSAVLKKHQSDLEALTFSPNGKLIATVSWDQTARIWSIPDGREVATLRHEEIVDSVQFNHAGSKLITGSRAWARVWRWNDAAIIAQPEPPRLPLTALVFSNDGALFAAAAGKTKESKQTPRIFFPSSSEDATCDGGCTIRIWNTDRWGVVRDLRFDGFVPGILEFSPDHRRLLAAHRRSSTYYNSSGVKGAHPCAACRAAIWNLGSGLRELNFELPEGRISDARFSVDGNLIAIATEQGSVYILDAKNGKQVAELRGHGESVKEIAFAPQGGMLLTASWDKRILLWDIAAGKTIRAFADHTDKVGHVAFDSSGTRFVSSSLDKTARIWETNTGKLIATLKGHTAAVNRAVFLQDGTLVATSSDDNTIMLWRAADGTRLHVLRGHSNTGAFSGVQTLASLADERLLSFGSDGALRIWDASLGVALAALTPPDQLASAMAVNPAKAQAALLRKDGLHIRALESLNALERIDLVSARSLPLEDDEIRDIPGLGQLAESLHATSDDQLADADLARTHAQLAEHFEAETGPENALACAFFHHRVAERLFRVSGLKQDADFQAARRISLTSLLSDQEVSRWWRHARTPEASDCQSHEAE